MRPLSATAALRLRSPQVTVTQPETTVQPASPAEQRQILQLGRLPRQLAAVIHFPQPLEPEGEQVARGGPAARPVRAQRPFRDKMNAHEHLPFPLL